MFVRTVWRYGGRKPRGDRKKLFDFVALPVQFLVEFLRGLAVGPGPDHINRTLFPDHIADPIGIVCLFG